MGIMVERHRYILDWYEIDKIEVPDAKVYYQFEYRFGPNWYLARHDYDEKTKKWNRHVWGRDDFRLNNPAQALVDLGEKVTGFTAISTGMGLSKATGELLRRAEEIRSRRAA